jgi:hypothetical protein
MQVFNALFFNLIFFSMLSIFPSKQFSNIKSFSMQGIFQKKLKVNNLEWIIDFIFFECVGNHAFVYNIYRYPLNWSLV